MGYRRNGLSLDPVDSLRVARVAKLMTVKKIPSVHFSGQRCGARNALEDQLTSRIGISPILGFY